MKEKIIIENAVLKNKNRVENKIIIPNKLKKYFTSDLFYAKYYDEQIDCPIHILNIPAVGAILPIAWVTNSDIEIEFLDKNFIESMYKMQNLYQNECCELKLDSEIYCKNIENIKNEIAKNINPNAMFFTGGVDSLYTLSSLIDLKPRLLNILGFTNRLELKPIYLNNIRPYYLKWAQKNNMIFNTIESNHKEIFDHRFYFEFDSLIKKNKKGAFKDVLQHIINTKTIVAPLSFKKFNKIYQADTWDTQSIQTGKIVSSSRSDYDDNIRWSTVENISHGGVARIDKIPVCLDFCDKYDIQFFTCWKYDSFKYNLKDFIFEGLNCNFCEKDLRTIVEILVFNRNPEKYGYAINDDTFKLFLKHMKGAPEEFKIGYYNKIIEKIPKEITIDIKNSKKFLMELRNKI